MKAPRAVDYEDVDDVIGIAAELHELDADRLSVEELEAVAKDLEIPEQYVGPAVSELRRRRKVLIEAEARRAKRNRMVAYSVAGVVVALLVWAFIGQASLASDASAVEEMRARVRGVQEDRAKKQSIYAGQPDSPEKKAALLGAETRVRAERMRYDEKVQAYNAGVTSFPGGLWAGIFGLPDAFPMSDQLAW